jgi:hypothetical protein
MKKILLSLALFAFATLAPAQIGDVVHSTAYEASHVLKSSHGVLLHLQGYNSKGSAQFIQVHDASSVPSDVVSGVAEISTFDTTGLTAAGLANKYFTLHGTTANAAFYVWFNLDAGGVDPAPGGTGIAVAIATGDSASSLATKTATAVDATAPFIATPSTNVVTITDAATGTRTDITAGNSGGAVAVSTQGVTAIAAAVPVITITAAASSNFTVPLPASGLQFSNGIAVSNSSTGPTKTAGSADVFFTALVQ